MLLSFINVQYCFDYLVNQIPMGLLLYSHLPVAVTALLFSLYVLFKSKNLPSLLLFSMCFVFTLWCLFDLSAWFSFLGSANTVFVWSLFDFLAVLMFFLAYYFLYTFSTGKDLPVWQKVAGVAAMLPSAYIALLGLNIPVYDLNSCAALEDGSLTIYTYYTEAFFIVCSLLFVIFQYRRSSNKEEKRRTFLAGTGVLIFLSFFFSACFSVSLLAATDASLYVYNYLIYGLFGMPIFLIYLGYIIVRYRAFDLRVFAAQALSVAMVVLVATQYAFLSGTSSVVLNSINLVLVSLVSLYLTRNVKKEIEAKEKIERQEKELEVINVRLSDANVKLKDLDKQKSEFVSFASHQLRSPLTAMKGYASLILEGDYGPISEDLKKAAQIIFDSTKTLATVVDDYLNVSRIELGQMKFDFTKFDLKDLVQSVVDEHKPNVDAAGLSLEFAPEKSATYPITADKEKLKQVIANVIDNSVKYTPKGSIDVSLEKTKDAVRVLVKDTGIGISKEVIPKLFSKFSRANNANKTNIRGTGLGLFIAKEIVTAHNGKIWVESEGEGKGSQFIIELKAAK